MQLDVHLHQGLLHVLDVRGCILDQPLPLAQVGAQCHHVLTRLEAAAQQTELMKLLEP